MDEQLTNSENIEQQTDPNNDTIDEDDEYTPNNNLDVVVDNQEIKNENTQNNSIPQIPGSPSSGDRSPKTFNLFVGDLRSEVSEEDLQTAFSPCGPIQSVHIIRDKITGEQRGFGFIHFKTKEALLNALKPPFNNIELKGRVVRVHPSDEKNTLWISGIPIEMNEEEITKELTALLPNTLTITHVELKTGPPPAYTSRGFAFVRFDNHETADAAKKLFSKASLRDRPLIVLWAEPTREVDDSVMATVKTLYVSNLHLAVTDEILRALFQQFGDIRNCVIVKNTTTRESRGFAFVEFTERKSCEQAIKSLKNTLFCGQPMDIVFAKPAPPEKSDKSTRGGNTGQSNSNSTYRNTNRGTSSNNGYIDRRGGGGGSGYSNNDRGRPYSSRGGGRTEAVRRGISIRGGRGARGGGGVGGVHGVHHVGITPPPSNPQIAMWPQQQQIQQQYPGQNIYNTLATGGALVGGGGPYAAMTFHGATQATNPAVAYHGGYAPQQNLAYPPPQTMYQQQPAIQAQQYYAATQQQQYIPNNTVQYTHPAYAQQPPGVGGYQQQNLGYGGVQRYAPY